MQFWNSHLTRNIFNLYMRRFFFGLVYSHKIGNLTRTCKTDASVNTYTVPIVTNVTPVPPLTVDYNSTVTYTCQDVHSRAARDITRTCKADAH